MRTLLQRLRDAEANGEVVWSRERYRRGVRPPYAAPWWQARVDPTTSWGLGVQVYGPGDPDGASGASVHLGPLYLSLLRYPGHDADV